MSIALQRPLTVEQFLFWAETQEERYEFDGIRPVAMTGGTKRHDLITGNIAFALRSRLRGKRCSNHGPNLGVQTIGSRVRYPDALITCTSFGDTDRLAPEVKVVFEVISPTSAGLDRIEKLREYAAVPSILRYAIVEFSTPGVLVLHRDHAQASWTAHALTRDDVLDIPEVDIRIPVSDLYEDVAFEEPGETDR